jgi:hypothetical protein
MAQPKSASEFLIVSVIVVGDSERPDFWTEAQLIPRLRSLIDGCPGFTPARLAGSTWLVKTTGTRSSLATRTAGRPMRNGECRCRMSACRRRSRRWELVRGVGNPSRWPIPAGMVSPGTVWSLTPHCPAQRLAACDSGQTSVTSCPPQTSCSASVTMLVIIPLIPGKNRSVRRTTCMRDPLSTDSPNWLRFGSELG